MFGSPSPSRTLAVHARTCRGTFAVMMPARHLAVFAGCAAAAVAVVVLGWQAWRRNAELARASDVAEPTPTLGVPSVPAPALAPDEAPARVELEVPFVTPGSARVADAGSVALHVVDDAGAIVEEWELTSGAPPKPLPGGFARLVLVAQNAPSVVFGDNGAPDGRSVDLLRMPHNGAFVYYHDGMRVDVRSTDCTSDTTRCKVRVVSREQPPPRVAIGDGAWTVSPGQVGVVSREPLLAVSSKGVAQLTNTGTWKLRTRDAEANDWSLLVVTPFGTATFLWTAEEISQRKRIQMSTGPLNVRARPAEPHCSRDREHPETQTCGFNAVAIEYLAVPGVTEARYAAPDAVTFGR
jgi:hypothetical protein